MCTICTQIQGNQLNAEEALTAIEKAVHTGTSRPEHFKAILDYLLGTELVDRDLEAEAEFESRYRDDEV